MIKLEKHQLEGARAGINRLFGTILSGTGTGKTFMQAEIIANSIWKEKNIKNPISMVKTGRIGLTNQVLDEYRAYFTLNFGKVDGKDFKAILVHSGSAKEDDFAYSWYKDIIQSFNGDWSSMDNEMKIKVIKKAKKNALVGLQIVKAKDLAKTLVTYSDMPVIVGTTYHSNLKVVKAIVKADMLSRLDVDINDEAQYLVRNDFEEIVDSRKKYVTRSQLFFTATPINTTNDITDEYIEQHGFTPEEAIEAKHGTGMANTERFGEVIFDLPDREAVARRLICPIRDMWIEPDKAIDDKTSKQKGFPIVIADTFKRLAEELLLVAEACGKDSNKHAKLLVTLRGIDIDHFLGSEQYANLIEEHPNLKILSVHSNPVLTTVNKGNVPVQIDRETFNAEMRKAGKDTTSPTIILHNDILAEGIDVQGLSGALILKDIKSWAKFKQIIGRVIRPWRDEKRIPQWDVKPCGYIFFPKLKNDSGMVGRYSKWCAGLYKEKTVAEVNEETEELGIDPKPYVVGTPIKAIGKTIDDVIKTEILTDLVDFNLPAWTS